MAELKVNIECLHTCRICGKPFRLNKEDHYVAREVSKTGFSAVAGGTEPGLWDAFDCPNCGCQNKMQPRLRITDILGTEYNKEDSDEEEED